MTWAVYISAIALGIVAVVVARFAGTWLVWTHGREWVRGYCAENAGRARDDVPGRYGRMARAAWLAGWDCSNEITPNTVVAHDAPDETAARAGGFKIGLTD